VTLAQRLTRRVEFRIAGQAWPLVITYRVLLDCQEIAGVDMLGQNLGDPSASLLRSLMYCALQYAGAPCSLEEVGRAIARAPQKTRRILAEAWRASLPDADPEREASDKRTGSPLTWNDVWAAAREEHRLSDDEWLDMTPRQFRALEDLRLNRLRREEFLVGMLAATTANFSFCAPKKPLTADNFLLHKLPETPTPEITGEYIMAQVANLKGKHRR
jgi:hypothetical protein